MSILTIVSIASGLASAVSWLYASHVKVSREKAVLLRHGAAAKTGDKPDLSGVTFDGWELRETLAAQSRWNSVGAVLAAVAIACQAASQALDA